jgi:hypothetical protein
MSSSVSPAIDRATAAADAFSTTDGATDWEGMWGQGLKAGTVFDAAKPETALLALIPGSGVLGGGLVASGAPLALAGKSCFVPGCGRAYAVEALSKGGAASAVGLELAPTAVAEARAHLATAEAGPSATVEEVHEKRPTRRVGPS